MQIQCSIIVLCLSLNLVTGRVENLSRKQRLQYKEKIGSMFYHAYDSYLKYATDYDELMPISCSGMNTWGTFSLSLIDALDTLAILGNRTEFQRVAQHLIDTASFETNTNVSVFETNIRVVGGLLSAHLLSKRAGMEVDRGWPCEGPLLRLAESVARKLLPAFETETGMPYGTVNFLHGVPENETPITCTAGVGTFIVEFGTLSRLTGDPIFETKALNALDGLQKYRSKLGLLGNHINVLDGKWTATEAGIGAGVDSYFEYLVKGSQLLQIPSLMEVFNYDYELIKNHMKKNDWFIWVNMVSGSATMAMFQSLESFFPGLLTLVGELEQAKKSLYNYHQVWKQYGFVPEFYDIIHGRHHKREGYPLRPEFAESVLYLYRATLDPHLLSIGADIVDSIEHSARTECGYATVKSVADHTIEDRMESFFLAETLKYLYLLFDEDNFLHSNGSLGSIVDFEMQNQKRTCVMEAGGWIFNTEAHPIDVAALACCYNEFGEDTGRLFEQQFAKQKSLYDILNFRKVSEENLKRYLAAPLEDGEDIPIEDRACDKISPKATYQIQPSFSHSSMISAPKKDSGESFEESQFAGFSEVATGEQSVDDILEESLDPTIPLSSTNAATTLAPSGNITNVYQSKISLNLSDEFDEYSENLARLVATIGSDEESGEDPLDWDNFEVMACPSQPFLARLSLQGEMFD